MFNWQETRELPWLKNNTILLTLVGSQAYGTATDESDYDYKGICIPPKEYVLGNLKTFYQSGFKYDNTEVEIYGLPKYISLAWEANPNILELLFTNEKHYVILNNVGRVLLKIREEFLSKKVKHTYSGYAHAQLKRIETHRKWLLYPPSHNPTREEYGLANTTLLSQDILGPIEALHSKEGEEYINKIFPEAILYVYFKERKYANAKRNWDQYVNWQTQRNPKRAELESKFGYDCYSYDTEFLTNNGWKLYDDITIQDKLATVFISPNGKDLTQRKHLGIEYQFYTDRFDGTFNGSLYHFYGNHIDTLVTPNHNMLIREFSRKNNISKENWELREAAHLPDCFEILRTPQPNRKQYCHNGIFNNLNISPRTYMLIMGWFLSDGCIEFRNHKAKTISISQKKGGKIDKNMSHMYSVQKNKIRIGLYEYERKPNRWRPYSIVEKKLSIREPSIVYKIYEDCGSKSLKHIPRYVFTLSKSLMDTLLKALIGGDSTLRQNGKSYIYYSNSRQLASDVQELAFMCGYETSLHGPYYSVRDDKEGQMFQVHIDMNSSPTKKIIRNNNIKRMEGPTRIVCFSVPNRTLITRRNGHISIHGNSKHASHLIRLLHTGIEILQGKGLHVDRSSIDKDLLMDIRNGMWSYEKLMDYANSLEISIDAAYNNSTLPHGAPKENINNILINILEEFYYGSDMS